MRRGASVALAVAFACLGPAAAARASITVANTNDTGAGSLRQAIGDAAPGEEIVVPAGTYTLTSGELAIAKSVTITGAGAGVTTVRSGGPFRVVHVTGAGNAVAIGQLAIRDGRSNAASGSKGAGVLDEDAALTLQNVTVAGNRADADGAPNVAGGVAYGGGVYSTGAGSLTLRDSVISGNDVSAAGGSGKAGGVASGGGVAATRLTLSGTLFDGNGAYAQGGQGAPAAGQSGGITQGGGLYVAAIAPTALTTSTLRANSSDASGGPGASGGIANGGGGWMLTNSPTISVANLTVFGNVARSGGAGGIASGGGLYYGTNNPGAASLTNATLNANGVSVGPGGMANGGNSFLGGVRVRNTVISAGVGPAGKENCGAVVVSLGHNLDSLGQCGFTAAGDLTNKDPLLGPLQDNGGPVPTEALPLSSPAINAGDNTGCPATDARGVSRPQGAACDIGAYEAQLPDLSVAGSASPQPVIGRNALAYAITVRNGGSVGATGVAVNVAIPAGATLVSARASAGGCSGRGPVSCALGGLAAGETASVRIVVRPQRPGTLTARATVTSTTPESSAANNATSVTARAAALAVGRLSVSPGAFRLGGLLPRLSASRVPTGTTIRFALPEAASVTLRFDRATSGRRSGRRCVAVTRRNRRARRCTRYAAAGTLTLSARAGSRRLRFQGRLSRRRSLIPGAYRLRASARDAAGSRSAIVATRFRLLAARGR